MNDNARMRERYQNDPVFRQKQLANARRYRATYPDRALRSANNSHMRAAYGIDLDERAQMEKNQNGACALCGEHKRLLIDHDHVSGRVRELLCFRCNIRLAGLEDATSWRSAALAYLEKHSHQR